LEARQPEVEEQPVNSPEPRRRRDRGQLPEVGLAEDEAIAEPIEASSDSGDGRPVGVETEEAAIRVARLQDPLGIRPTTVEE
jgi:hypothetical protein